MSLPWENVSVSWQEETKSIEMVPKDIVHEGRSNSPQQFSFLSLAFFHFYISISLFRPHVLWGKVK